jgi:hypothetical protein
VSHRSAVVAIAPLLGLLGLLGAACAGGDGGDTRADTVQPSWQAVTLPVPPGPAGRVAVRDATSCDGTWYVVGAVLGPDGSSRPAGWTSDDARTWRPMDLAPRSYYARRAILSSVACRDGKVAAVGARSGGAHGNPRVTSWYQRADGALVDMPATFELYGGPEAISVRRVAAGPDGWLIAGNRLRGAAVWFSRDATDFRLVDDDPALCSDPDHATSALDQVHDGTDWTVVGRVETPGQVAPGPYSWTSHDGLRWTRHPVPAGTGGFADLERVVRAGTDELLAAGLRDQRFGTWRRVGGTWRTESVFGRLAAGSTGAPFVSGLTTGAHGTLAAVSDGARLRLWLGLPHGDWRQVAVPVRPSSTGDHQLTAVADGSRVLLLTDDGSTGRAWVASWDSFRS